MPAPSLSSLRPRWRNALLWTLLASLLAVAWCAYFDPALMQSLGNLVWICA